MPRSIYLIGSLRNPRIPVVAAALRKAGHDVFDDWYAAGPTADDSWQAYEQGRGRTYLEALESLAARHVFAFDREHIDRCDTGVLVMPAGKSAHIEIGYMAGKGKDTFVYFPPGATAPVVPLSWRWLAGVYEGEGSITRNGRVNGVGLQLTVSMKDEDVVRRLLAVSGVGTVEGPYVRDNPKWAPMWRWAVRRKSDVLHVLRGMWVELGQRRRAQALKVLAAGGVSESELFAAAGPAEFRWDCMYQFTRRVVSTQRALLKALA